MLNKFRQRQPGRSLVRIIWWQFCHALCVIWFYPFYRFKHYHHERIPATGPVLMVSNHQSMLDPIIVGLGSSHRQFYAMARATLWNSKLLGWVMNSLNAIPVDQDKPDASTMKRCIDVLKQDHALLIFPEGARTLTGTTQPFEPGTMLIIKRAKPTIVPVAVQGAYDVWPRTQSKPKLIGKIACLYGNPIPAEDLLAMNPKDALKYLQDRVESLRLQLIDKVS